MGKSRIGGADTYSGRKNRWMVRGTAGHHRVALGGMGLMRI